jgi:hypothetical protein
VLSLTISFSVMVRIEKTTSAVQQDTCMDVAQNASPTDEHQRQTDDLQQQIQLLELEQAELECAFAEESFFHNKGVILQFINNNCTGATSLIGGIRLHLDDIRKIPAYLDRNASRIKHYAILCLDRHIKANQCATGAGEVLCNEDYGISFSLASVSQRGMMLHPSKRQEGQLFYCLYPGLNEPFFLGTNPDGTDDMAHVVNVFIHLMPIGQRRTAVLLKLDKENPPPTLCPMMPTASAPVPIPNHGGKRQRNPHGNHGSHPYHNANNRGEYQGSYRRQPAPIQDNSAQFYQRIDALEKDVQTVKTLQLPNPPLPVATTPIWRKDGVPELPVGL